MNQTPSKIIEYGIALQNNPAYLAEEVNKRIKQGWQPYGNIVLTANANYMQSMLKYELTNDKSKST